MDDYNGTHESGHFMELLMDGDYRNYCDDFDDGDYNNVDNNDNGDNNDDDDGESSDSDDDSDSDSDDDDSNDDSDEEFYQLVAVTCEAVVTYFNKYINKTPCYDSEQTGWVWVRRCMEGNEKLCYNMFRMKKEVFHNLCQVLQHDYGLEHTRNIRLEESVAICLLILGHGTCNRMVQEIFQHSGETISRHFEKMITLLGARFAAAYVKPSDPTFSEVPTKIQDHPIYWPHFKDCIGAIDGTHVMAVVPTEKSIPYFGRKGYPTQNVMAACDFDMLFTFVLPGWEGAAHDTSIFLDTIRKQSNNFPHPPPGKYYVVDSGYPMMKGYLAPYKGISYHLQEFRRRGGSPRTRHEKFNHAHSSLRCTIERTFGVWKNKWRIIRNMPSFPFHIQILIVSATMALHNFVRLNDRDDMGFINATQDSISRREHNSEAGSSYEQNSGTLTDPAMVVLRDSIANSIWEDNN
ncbi:protein ALP1-like [Quercus robur]|uniref:protein ALP1-like n=2 Tax=Quercus robur TaxID=38942 RepID=UPI002163C685|nr:protein ALP1-like [Quercus robur]